MNRRILKYIPHRGPRLQRLLVTKCRGATARSRHQSQSRQRRLLSYPAALCFWRVEAFPTAAEAQTASSSHSLMVETLGKVWLFTLPASKLSHHAAEPRSSKWSLAKVEAGEYLLRVNEGHGPPGGDDARAYTPWLRSVLCAGG